tara:strand:+ start:60 stop:464 length:405 start_codon:yes stop_codon:yes gene_type:complete
VLPVDAELDNYLWDFLQNNELVCSTKEIGRRLTSNTGSGCDGKEVMKKLTLHNISQPTITSCDLVQTTNELSWEETQPISTVKDTFSTKSLLDNAKKSSFQPVGQSRFSVIRFDDRQNFLRKTRLVEKIKKSDK